jgi:hypothetical protein
MSAELASLKKVGDIFGKLSPGSSGYLRIFGARIRRTHFVNDDSIVDDLRASNSKCSLYLAVPLEIWWIPGVDSNGHFVQANTKSLHQTLMEVTKVL